MGRADHRRAGHLRLKQHQAEPLAGRAPARPCPGREHDQARLREPRGKFGIVKARAQRAPWIAAHVRDQVRGRTAIEVDLRTAAPDRSVGRLASLKGTVAAVGPKKMLTARFNGETDDFGAFGDLLGVMGLLLRAVAAHTASAHDRCPAG